MATDPTSLDPGSMTVPPLFGWENIVVVLALMAIVAAAFLVTAAARGPVNERSEWQAWLGSRSSAGAYRASDVRDPEVARIHPSRQVLPDPKGNVSCDARDVRRPVSDLSSTR